MRKRTKLFHGKPNNNDFSEILSGVSKHDLYERKHCSTIPLMVVWMHFEKILPGILQGIDGENGGKAEICFEYPVSPKSGRGKASMTDVMIFSNKSVIAIEGKWTERNKKISTWLGKEARAGTNKWSVLNYWFESILGKNERGFHYEAKGHGELDYQMLHRTASSFLVAREKRLNPVVIYQIFWDQDLSDSKRGETGFTFTNKYFKSILDFKKALPVMNRIRFYLQLFEVTGLNSTIKNLRGESGHKENGGMYTAILNGDFDSFFLGYQIVEVGDKEFDFNNLETWTLKK